MISVIALVNAIPTDYNDQSDESHGSPSASDESDENLNIATGIFTKYPDDPDDSYTVSEIYELPTGSIRIRRKINTLTTNATSGGTHTQNINQSEENTEEPTKVPLRGIITAVESDLVTKALQVNAELHQRRKRFPSNGHTSNKNVTNTASYDDSYTNLFEGLSNITRSHRDTGNENEKIALDDIVDVVESTLVNSAELLREPKSINHDNGTLIETIELNESHQIKRDSENVQKTEVDHVKQPDIQVQTLNTSNLNILSPITFKPTTVEHITVSTINSDEKTDAPTKVPVRQKTNLDVVHVTKTISVTPNDDKNITHIQQQQISTTVFHSNLAIFPTIPPHTINTPLSHSTSAIANDESVSETTITSKLTSNTNENDELRQKAEQLKEKFAEIEAQPVIFSTI